MNRDCLSLCPPRLSDHHLSLQHECGQPDSLLPLVHFCQPSPESTGCFLEEGRGHSTGREGSVLLISRPSIHRKLVALALLKQARSCCLSISVHWSSGFSLRSAPPLCTDPCNAAPILSKYLLWYSCKLACYLLDRQHELR